MKKFIILAASLGLSACSSFQGQPTPILPMHQYIKAAQNIDMEASLFRFHYLMHCEGYGCGEGPARAHRNYVLLTYLTAIDARYSNYVMALSKQNKGMNVGLSTAALGLSTAATLTTRTAANILSGGAAFSTGSQAQLNERLFFDKALPAIIVAMNSNRTKARTAIILGMSKAANSYPLELGVMDLATYQDAGSFDVAIAEVTNSTVKNAADVDQKEAQARGQLDGVSEANPLLAPPAPLPPDLPPPPAGNGT